MYGSPNKVALENLLEFYTADLQITISQMVDTLSPAVLSMEAVQIVLQMMIQNTEYVQKNGKSEKANESAKKLMKLFECVTKLNKITGDMNTLQLQNKEFYVKMKLAQKENIELKQRLQNIVDAENFGQ